MFTGGPLSPRGNVYEWRAEAGKALMHGGFDNFSNAFKGNYTSAKNWDINQLKSEQNLLQPIHEKYLKDNGFIRGGALIFNGIPNVKSYEDRVEFGCKSMGYIAKLPLRATTRDILNFYESISYKIKDVA